MSWSSPPGHSNSFGTQEPGRSSPLRYNSNASTSSSAYSMSSNPFLPSRTSTLSSTASSTYSYSGAGHKRGISEASLTQPDSRRDGTHKDDNSAASGYKSVRQSLRPLPQAPNKSKPPATHKAFLPQYSSENSYYSPEPHYDRPSFISESDRPIQSHINAAILHRAGSMTPKSSSSYRGSDQIHGNVHDHHGPKFTSPDLGDLKTSSTPYLIALS